MLIYQLLQKGTASTRPPLYQKQSDGAGGNNSGPPASQTMMLACSSSSSSALNQKYHDLIYANRKLCEDRRGVFDHLRPRSFVKNTVRICVMQSTTVVTTYFNDQLKEDTEREERIQKGDITRALANKEDEEWQEVSGAGGCLFCWLVGCWIRYWNNARIQRVERPLLKPECCITCNTADVKKYLLSVNFLDVPSAVMVGAFSLVNS